MNEVPENRVFIIRSILAPDLTRRFDVVKGTTLYRRITDAELVQNIIPYINNHTIILTGEDPAADKRRWNEFMKS